MEYLKYIWLTDTVRVIYADACYHDCPEKMNQRFLNFFGPLSKRLHVWFMFCFFLSLTGFGQLDSLLKVLPHQELQFKGLADTNRINTLLKLGNYYQYSVPDSAMYYHRLANESADAVLQKNKTLSLNEGAYFSLKKSAALRELGWDYYVIGDYEQSMKYYDAAIVLVEEQLKLKLNPLLHCRARWFYASALGNKASLMSGIGDHAAAIKLANEALEIEKELGLEKGQARSIGNMGLYYTRMANYPKAIECYFEALALDEKNNNLLGQAANYGNLGVVYFELDEFDKALQYLERSLEIKIQLEDKVGESINVANIALIYHNKKDYPKALEYYNRAVALDTEMQRQSGLAATYGNIGVLYRDMGDDKKAMEYYEKALKICLEIGDMSSEAYELAHMGEVYLRSNRIADAEKLFLRALEISRELHEMDGMSSYYQSLSEVYEKSGNYKKALENYRNHIIYRDSVYSAEATRSGLEKELQYEFNKQAAADSVAFAKQQEIDQIQIDKQNAELDAKENQQVALFGGLFLVLVFAGFMYNRFKVTQKQKGIIETQKYEVEHQKHLVDEKQKEIIDSINYARRIQAAILPPERLVRSHLPNSFILYLPKDIVAGDFYWFQTVGSGRDQTVLFAVADCTGHGVPGAMVSVVCNNALNRAVREYGITDPGKILDKTREIVISEFEKSDEEVKDGMDISLCSLSISTGILNWAGANNPLWILRNGSAEIEEIKADKQPIGKFAESKPFTTHQTKLQPGDTIYIFSDGFQDQFGGNKGKKFKASQLKELIVSNRYSEMSKQEQLLKNEFGSWKGSLEQLDDVCVIGVRI